jgi:hypothetical protein
MVFQPQSLLTKKNRARDEEQKEKKQKLPRNQRKKIPRNHTGAL